METGNLDWAGGRFVIIHGLGGQEIGKIMAEVRKLAKGRVIFATTTETNLNWTLEELLEELRREDEYFRAMREAKLKKGPFLNIGNVK